MKISFYIRQEQRLAWDFFVLLVIFYVAFEVPYDLFVGWENLSTKKIVDTFIYAVFIIDMVLNCFTEREKSFNGFWGWRFIAGFFNINFSAKHQKNLQGLKPETYRTQPKLIVSYLKSGWFLIDLIAVFPFDILFSALSFTPFARTLRLLRIGKLFRLLRIARFLKTFRLFSIVRAHLEHYPALRRLIYISIFVPWLGFVHACFFYLVEQGNPATEINTFTGAIHKIFFEFIASEGPGNVTSLGYFVSVSAILNGLLFFGLFIGNFAAFFEQIDHDMVAYDEKIQSWQKIFNNYKDVFDAPLKEEVLDHIKRGSLLSSIENHSIMIKELDSTLEVKIKTRMKDLASNKNCPQTKKLLQYLEG